MDILNPPTNYINFRCATNKKESEEFFSIRKKFYKEFDCEEEVVRFLKWLHKAQEESNLPIERIEVREGDGLKHGRVESLMIYDIEYWREQGKIKQRKIYIPVIQGAKFIEQYREE